jgi:hypothetical protein
MSIEVDSLIVGGLWAYKGAQSGKLCLEHDCLEFGTLKLTMEEAAALRDWLIKWMPLMSMPRFAPSASANDNG